MDKKIMLYIAIMVLGLYVMPNSLALFAGQHTFVNGMGVSCDRCHSDVLEQIQASGNVYVSNKHKAAAGNSNYTTYLSIGGKTYNGSAIIDYNNVVWNWVPASKVWTNSNTSESRNVSLDKDNNGINGAEICMLCHNSNFTGSNTHTGVVVMVCDDDRCHGNRKNVSNNATILGSNNSIIAAGASMGMTNIHQAFYLESGNQSSSYAAASAFGPPGNEYDSSGFTSRGHWACEGCHSESNVDVVLNMGPLYNHTDSDPGAPRRY